MVLIIMLANAVTCHFVLPLQWWMSDYPEVGVQTYYFYRPQQSWAKVIFSQACVCPWGGVCPCAYWDTPQITGADSPPGADPLRADTPQEETPPRADPPPAYNK